MTIEPVEQTVLFLRAELDEPVVLSLPMGDLALHTARSPLKSADDDENEDAAAVIPVDDERAVLVVADGVGGHAAGAEASSLALREIADAVAMRPDDDTLRSSILNGIERANRAVLDMNVGAGTTVAIAVIDHGVVRPYHVGDSAIFVVGQRGKLKFRTVDHSPVGYAVEAGILDRDAALHHAERHVVSNIVGASAMHIDVGAPLRLRPRDTVLLGSDGLIDNLFTDEIVEIVRMGPIGAAAERLCRTASERMLDCVAGHPSKPDDLTFVVFRLRPPRRQSRR